MFVDVLFDLDPDPTCQRRGATPVGGDALDALPRSVMSTSGWLFIQGWTYPPPQDIEEANEPGIEQVKGTATTEVRSVTCKNLAS